MRTFLRPLLLAPLFAALSCSDAGGPLSVEPEVLSHPVAVSAANTGGTSAGGSASSSAAVTTDKADYQPGQLVTITGAGWVPGETVHLHIVEEPPNHPDHHFDVVADVDGNFVHAELVMDELHLGVTFTLTATGQTSGMVAEALFTDNHGHTLDCLPSSVAAGSPTTCTATITGGTGGQPSSDRTVNFASDGAGAFSAANCTTSGTNSTASCAVTYTPTTGGTHVITAEFIIGPGGHNGEEDFVLTVTGAEPRPTSTLVECVPDAVVVNQQTTCTATVSDTGTGTKSDPAGDVSFTVTGGNSSNADFGAASCGLVGNGDGTSDCSVTYTPTAASTHVIEAVYEGSDDHEISDDTFDLTVSTRTTTTSVVCSPATVVVNQATECTATVADTETAGTKEAPLDQVDFDVSGGSSSNADFDNSSCSLTAIDGESSSCSVTYTPSAASTHTIAADYTPGGGSTNVHGGSVDTFDLTVDTRATTTTVICSPASVVVNQATECTATVADTESLGTTAEPDGQVDFSVSGGNSSNLDFDNGSCNLVGGGDGESSTCSVTYTPSAASTHTIAADYTPGGGSTNVHTGSGDTFALTVDKRTTTTTISCVPDVQMVNENILCTATVTDVEVEGTKAAPTDDVDFERSGSAEASCTLAADSGVSSSCSINVTSATPTVDEMVALYVGPSNVHKESESEAVLIVFYDPSAGFVTGGGWIWSLPGAAPAYPGAEGKANFGFVSKYQRGANVPDGNTQFQFKAGDINFHSTSYQWLVVSGARAQYKGEGSLNGEAGFGFILTAIDGQVNGGGGVDRFRIKIVRLSNDSIVYDNQMGASDTDDPVTALGGGSIVIHTGGNGKK